MVVLLAVMRSMAMSAVTSRAARESAVATAAARQIVETLKAEDFGEVFARYNADPADDPAGAGTAPGSALDVVGLQALPNDPDGLVAEVRFPVAPGAPGALREDVDAPEFGTPMDLNGDGLTDGGDHSGDYRVLPVVVRLRWRGAAGSTSFELRTMLTEL